MSLVTLELADDTLTLNFDGQRSSAPFEQADWKTLATLIAEYDVAREAKLGATSIGGRLSLWLDSKHGDGETKGWHLVEPGVRQAGWILKGHHSSPTTSVSLG